MLISGRQCEDDAYYVLIYSCFQEHIRERPMCPMHTGEWIAKFDKRKWSCTDCDTKQYIEAVHLCLADEVTEECLNI
jgi:hypothetical protein